MLNKTIAKFVFYAVCVILFTWTSSLTYSFLSMARPDALDNPYGRVTHPVLRDQIDNGRLPPQPPIPTLEKEPATYPNGHSRGNGTR